MASYIVQATAVTAMVFYAGMAPTFKHSQVEQVNWVVAERNTAAKAARFKATLHPVGKIAPQTIARMQPKTAVLKIAVPVLQVQQPTHVRRSVEIAEVAQPQLSVASPRFDSKVLNLLPGPKATSKIVATNNFGGSSATPTLPSLSAAKVQTGGFGNPDGVPANAHGSNRSTIASSGSFDLPPAMDTGSGAGGNSHARGTVIASAGFGNGVAAQGGGGQGGSASQGRIQSTNFVTAPATSNAARGNKAASQAISSPVSIQSKPTPVYTTEARQLKVEGEVLLNVVFKATGQIRILNMVRGLGHGLDEAAQRAAQGVRFSPAMRDGHAVDSNVTLHIVFQLS